jgi:hypothetical protein
VLVWLIQNYKKIGGFKMRKILSVFFVFALLFTIIAYTLPAGGGGPDPNPEDPWGGSGGGSTETWSRYDYPCVDPKKEKTNCISGGNEQCTAKYCN